MPNDITTPVSTSHWWLSSQHSVHNEKHASHTHIHMHLQQKPSTLTNCFQLSNLCWLQIPLTSNNNNHRFKAIMRKKSPQGFHQTTTITTMFPLRLCGGRLLVEAMREQRYGPSRLRVNDNDDSSAKQRHYIWHGEAKWSLGHPALASTFSQELEDFVGTKFYGPHALADGNQHIRIREKTLEFSSTVLFTLSPYLYSLTSKHQTKRYSRQNIRTFLTTHRNVDIEYFPTHWRPSPVTHKSLYDLSRRKHQSDNCKLQHLKSHYFSQAFNTCWFLCFSWCFSIWLTFVMHLWSRFS